MSPFIMTSEIFNNQDGHRELRERGEVGSPLQQIVGRNLNINILTDLSSELHGVTIHSNRLYETIRMNGHIIEFDRWIRKYIVGGSWV